jgi:hypothetical protein
LTDYEWVATAKMGGFPAGDDPPSPPQENDLKPRQFTTIAVRTKLHRRFPCANRQ